MSAATAYKPEVRTFGPCRVIGVSYVAGKGNCDFAGVWAKRLMPRMGEIGKVATPGYFGICRCIPGATDGTWEYVAAVEAKADAAVPAGMVAIQIPACEYAVFAVKSLTEIGAAWPAATKVAGEMEGFEPCCGAKGCQCATHPAFEYYPPGFQGDGGLYLYIPIRRGAHHDGH